MNMFNRLPYFVILQGQKYKINVDFRNMISFEKKIEDKNVDISKKVQYGLQHFYPYFYNIENYQKLIKNKELYKEACNKLIWFYKCGRENYHKTIKKGKKGKANIQIYSYDFDDEYIWGAFHELHGIDLSIDKVHWWKFKAILNSLPENTQFNKIKSYRAYDGDNESMLDLKEYWKLPISTDEQDRLNRIYETLK